MTTVVRMTSKNYYKILESEPNCPRQTIELNYQRLIAKYAKIKNTSNKDLVERKINEIQEAFNVLGNAEKRALYDSMQNKIDREEQIYKQRLKFNHAARIISCFSLKGGAGNSLFSLQFAHALAASGKQTLLIDLDCNNSVTLMCRHQFNIVNDDDLSPFTERGLVKKLKSHSLPFHKNLFDYSVAKTKVRNLSLLPGNKDLHELAGFLQDEFNCNFPFFKSMSKIETLSYVLENYGKQNKIEYIVIDLPTQQNRLCELVMPVSNFIISPIRLDFFAQFVVDPTQSYVAKCVSKCEASGCKFLGFVFNVMGQNALADEFIREQSDEIALLITMQLVSAREFLFDGDGNFASEVKFLLKDIEKKDVAPFKRKSRDDDLDDDVIDDDAEPCTSSTINFFPTGKRARI